MTISHDALSKLLFSSEILVRDLLGRGAVCPAASPTLKLVADGVDLEATSSTGTGDLSKHHLDASYTSARIRVSNVYSFGDSHA